MTTARRDPSFGTYTPTISGTTNVTASSPSVARWTRIGDFVTVTGYCALQPTMAVSTKTVVGISLPIASNLTAFHQLAGIGSFSNSPGSVIVACQVYGNATTDVAELIFAAPSAAAGDGFTYDFTYPVL